ncbi:hypothetical protein [Pseudomonas serbica]|uniref:hypothetical protein n=1 Tax=Pseudomonas serbica TaxID=2965074 RepID=UPI00237AF8B0|nr:hypothetical protein [Pseudomonas serbica]
MTDIAALESYAGTLSEAAQRSEAASLMQHELMNGDAHTDVLTESGPVPTLAKQARLYSEAIPDAVVELSAQMTDGKIHPSEAAGRLAVADLAYFYVKSSNPLISRSLYQRINADTSVHVVDDASAASMAELHATVNQLDAAAGARFFVADPAGFGTFMQDADGGFGSAEAYMGADAIENQKARIETTDSADFQMMDEVGFVSMEMVDGVLRSPAFSGEGSGGVDQLERLQIGQRNAANLAASAAVRGDFNSEVQRAVAKYNHFLMYGQSLSTAYEGWPALSKIAKDGSLMYGDCARPASGAAATFAPLGGAALKPLKSVVQVAGGGSILSDADVAALAPGAANEGEGPEVGAVNFARHLFLQHHGLAKDDSRLFVASSAGVAGRSIEQLSKGASPELYQRLLQAAQGVKTIAAAESASYCVPAIFWMQGEWNYTTAYGGDTTKAGYKAKLKAQAEIWKADIALGVAGQASPPAIITYQAGAGYTSDSNDLAIGMAQWELSEEERNWFMATPIYPYTDKGGHLDSNGYRWVGMQLGKVLHRVVTLGQDWKPLSPRRLTLSGRQVLIDFHVPCPPLVFDQPYVLLAGTDYADKGFRVLDDLGAVPIASVAIAADTVVELVLGRDTFGVVKVQYASKTVSNGNGNLRDSDGTVACENYVYQAGSGQYAGANILALVDRPYPLHNWCIAFSLTPELI